MGCGGHKVALRADGSGPIGLGHVMRCLALGASLVEQGAEVRLLSAPLPDEIGERARRVGVEVHEVTCSPGGRDDALHLAGMGPDLVVVDGYEFDSAFFGTLADEHCPHVVVDDNGDTSAIAPIMVINQNPHARPAMYDHLASHPQLLLGLDFVLLREEIRRAPRREPGHRDDEVVFVALGGSDPRGLTQPIARELARAGVAARVAVGAATPHRESVIDALLTDGVDVIEPSEFEVELATAAVAVVGAGSTMWEAAYLGVPSVGVVVAPNQVAASAEAEHLGIVHAIDGRSGRLQFQVASIVEQLLLDDEARSGMSCLGRRLVDGTGVDRVCACILDHIGRFR